MKVSILSHSASNSISVMSACCLLDIESTLCPLASLDSLEDNSWLIIPGVGNISSLSSAIEDIYGVRRLSRLISDRQLNVIGICLGLQFLCKRSAESSGSATLGLLDLDVCSIHEKPTPNVGWYGLTEMSSSESFSPRADLRNDLCSAEYYYTHSYACKRSIALGDESIDPSAKTSAALNIYSYNDRHGNSVIGAVLADKIYGFQFHPEKSGKKGLSLLKNVLQGGVSNV